MENKTVVRFISLPHIGKADIIIQLGDYLKVRKINLDITSVKELEEVFENAVMNVPSFQQELRKRSEKNYLESLKKRDTEVIADDAPLELINLYSTSYAQMRYTSDYTHQLFSRDMEESMKRRQKEDEARKVNVLYIYLLSSPEEALHSLNDIFGRPLMEETALYNLHYLIKLHEEMNSGRKFVINMKTQNDPIILRKVLNFILTNLPADSVIKQFVNSIKYLRF